MGYNAMMPFNLENLKKVIPIIRKKTRHKGGIVYYTAITKAYDRLKPPEIIEKMRIISAFTIQKCIYRVPG